MEKESSKKSKNRMRMSYLLAFFAAFFAFFSCVTLVFKVTVFNADFYTSIIQESKYCEYLTDDIKKDIAHLCQVTIEDAPEDLYKNMITRVKVINSSLEYFSSSFKGATTETETTLIENNFKSKLKIYISQTYPNLAESKEVDASIKMLASECAKIYKNAIRVQLVPKIGKIAVSTKGYLDVAAVVSIVISLSFFSGVIMINRRKSKRLKYFVISITSLFLMIVLVPITFMLFNLSNRFAIDDKRLYTLASDILSAVTMWFWMLAIVLMLLSIMAIIINYLYKKYRTKSKKHKSKFKTISESDFEDESEAEVAEVNKENQNPDEL